MIKNKKGITLIALIVTIIVLLILAGVSIAVLIGENGILNRATEAKKTTEESEVKENIRLAFNNAQIGKHSGANEVFEDKMESDLELTYGNGNVTVTKESDKYIIEIIGKGIYEILADGTVQKQGANIVVGVATITDENGAEITTKVKEGTEQEPVFVYIRFTANLMGASNLMVSLENHTPTLINGMWVTPVKNNGTYRFTIEGTVDGAKLSTTTDVKVTKFSNGLEIGSEVLYSPSGNYSWKARYALGYGGIKSENEQRIEDSSNDIELSSANGGNCEVTTWRVLKIDDALGEVQLIPKIVPSAQLRLDRGLWL